MKLMQEKHKQLSTLINGPEDADDGFTITLFGSAI
jgi:hypothetical protein